MSILGALLILLEIAIFQRQTKDVSSKARLVDRIFGKFWLRMGMSSCLTAKLIKRKL